MFPTKFSPLSTPSKKRSGIIAPEVVAAWAMVSGWILMVGRVPVVPSLRLKVPDNSLGAIKNIDGAHFAMLQHLIPFVEPLVRWGIGLLFYLKMRRWRLSLSPPQNIRINAGNRL